MHIVSIPDSPTSRDILSGSKTLLLSLDDSSRFQHEHALIYNMIQSASLILTYNSAPRFNSNIDVQTLKIFQ